MIPTIETVLNAAAVMHAHCELDDGELVARLCEAGLSEEEAEHVIVFLPLAFARPILLRMRVAVHPRFIAETRAGKRITLQLADQPWYAVALRVAVATVTHGYATEGCAGQTLAKDVFTSVLSRSPEIGVVSQFTGGEDLSGVVISEVVVLRLPAESFERKPRWKFWG